MQEAYRITTIDFRRYLQLGLGIDIRIPDGWNFKMVYKSLLKTHPTLAKLANLIENALFLKLLFCRHIHLNASSTYPSNNDHTFADYRFVCAHCGRHNC